MTATQRPGSTPAVEPAGGNGHGNRQANGNGNGRGGALAAGQAATVPAPPTIREALGVLASALLLLAAAIDAKVRPLVRPAAPFVPAAAAVGVWLLSLRRVDLRAMNDLGVVSVLPWEAYAALGVLTAGFCLALSRRPLRTAVLATHVVVLCVVLYGLLTPIEEVARLSVSWRHAGIADHIAQTGEVDPRIDAYFNWPGFFALLAMATELSGVDAMRLASWASVANNLLFVLPVVVIARALTRDGRAVWLAAWVFLLANWVGQDYLSPQAFAFFLHLVVVAVLLTWFRPTAGRPDPDAPPARAPRPALRVLLLVVVLVLLAAIVPSHQLTPFAALAAVAALVVVRRCTARGLPVLLAAMVGAWISFMTVAYMKSHVGKLLDSVGDLGANTGTNVGARLAGSPEHVFVVRVRLLLTAALWGLALFGAVRRWRRGRRDVAWLALGAAPFPLIGLQSYGGEMLLRVYLFALPFAALFVALLVFPARAVATSAWRLAAVAGLSLVLAPAFLLSRYGNERENQFSADERAAVDRLYDVAPPGSLVVAAVDNLPWRSEQYAVHDHETLVRFEEHRGHGFPHVSDALELLRSQPPGCAFLVVTRSQHAKIALEGIWAPEALPAVVDRLRRAPDVATVHASEDAVVLRMAGPRAGACTAGAAT